MKRKFKRAIRIKLLILPILILFLFSTFKIGSTFASIDKLVITGAEVLFESDTVEINNFKYEKCKIISDVTFHKIGDIITYKINIKNNDEKEYTIKSITDNNKNEYISYTYDIEKTTLESQEEVILLINQKYSQELIDLSNREQDLSLDIIFTLEDENGNKSEEEIPLITYDNSKEDNQKETQNEDASTETEEEISIQDGEELEESSTKIIEESNANLADEKITNDIEEKNSKSGISNIKAKSSNPKTFDDINIYIVTAISSLLILIICSKRKKEKSVKVSKTGKHSKAGIKLFGIIILVMFIIPVASKAASLSLLLEVNNTVKLKDKLIFSYKIGDSKYEEIVNYGEKVTYLNDDPEKEGYTFKGWLKQDGTFFDKNSILKSDETVIAIFEPISYSIGYDLNGENVQNNNPTLYTIETENITLNKPSRTGYKFIGWTGTDLDGIVENVTISKGSKGKREYVANWEEEVYNITYQGLTSNISTRNMKKKIAENPTTYTINSDDIYLIEPQKAGYEFEGWTGSNLDGQTKEVAILKGSTGDKEYMANWTPATYTITYEGITDEEEANLKNPSTYNIETENIKLNNPSNRIDKDGDTTEIFVGWQEYETVSTGVTIETGSYGDRVFEAIWKKADPNIYIITYDLDNGTLEKSNPTSFTKYTNTFTLNNPQKAGYKFIGWTGSNGEKPDTKVEISQGTRENLTYKANWEEETYNISYDLRGGSIENKNPEQYTINSDEIVLNNPTRYGYKFIGWTGTDLEDETIDVVIPKKSFGNRTYTANWKANTYKIVFNSNTGEGSMQNQQMTYDISDKLISNIFTKLGYTFVNWNTQADGKGTSYESNEEVLNLAKEGEIILYAQWKLNDNTVATANGKTFNSLQAAIDDVSTDNIETTVTLLTDISENVIVKQGQNIVFDFQNFTISNKANSAIISNNGTIKISNGNIKSSQTSAAVINNFSTGNVTISGGKIEVIDTNGKQVVYNNKDGVVTITGDAYLSSVSTSRASVQNVTGGILNVTGGTIIENGTANQPAVSNAGTLNIGVKDGIVNRKSPILQGVNYGLSSSSGFNFYDGILKGKSAGVNDENKIVDTEPENIILHSSETIDDKIYKTAFLGISKIVTFDPNVEDFNETTREIELNNSIGELPVLYRTGFEFEGWFTQLEGGEKITKDTLVTSDITVYAHWKEVYVAEINGTKYRSLKAAISEVKNNTKTTVKLLHDTCENVTITQSQNIVLNLQEFTISNNSNDAVITNNGTLVVTGGKILSNSENTAAINNNKNIQISNISIICTGERQAVYNKGGTVEILENSYLKSSSVDRLTNYTLDRGTVQNIDGGTVIITGGTIINVNQQAVSNEATLILGTKDSTVNTETPILIGKDHGVKNIGTFKFYDGIIKGYTDAISGEVAEIPEGYKIGNSIEEINGVIYKTITLILDEIIEQSEESDKDEEQIKTQEETEKTEKVTKTQEENEETEKVESTNSKEEDTEEITKEQEKSDESEATTQNDEKTEQLEQSEEIEKELEESEQTEHTEEQQKESEE